MAITKDQFRRIRIIHEALLSYLGYNFSQLLEKVNTTIDKPVSKRTLFLDLALLRELGAPIERAKKNSPYRYTNSFSLFDVFNPTEAELLSTAIHLLRRVSTLSRVEAILPELNQFVLQLEAAEKTEKKVVFFDDNQLYQGSEYLGQLFGFINAETVLKIDYSTFDGLRYEGSLHPYLLKEYNGRWYLYGREHNLGEIHRFPLDRIRNIIACNEITYIPNDFWDAKQHFSEMVGISRKAGQTPEKITIRSYGTTSDYLLTKPLHHSQQLLEEAETYCDFEYFVIRNYEFESLLRSFGEGVVEI
jgi:predicted DNA-binding transcriptional regulator YafY